MKNKGFTLVELLAVIVVFALVVVIMVYSFGNVLSSTKSKISDINRKNLIEAGETLGVYVTTWELTLEHYEILGINDNKTCSNAKEVLKTGVDINVIDLKNANLFIDNAGVCEGNINIKLDNNDKIKVMLDDVICTEEN